MVSIKCEVCKNEINDTKFKYLLVHNATKEDYEHGAFSDTDIEMMICYECCLNLNFRGLKGSRIDLEKHKEIINEALNDYRKWWSENWFIGSDEIIQTIDDALEFMKGD